MKNKEAFLINIYSRSFYLSFTKENKNEDIKKNYLLSLDLKKIFYKNNNDYFFYILKLKKKEESKKIIETIFKNILDQKWINLFFIMIDDNVINYFLDVLKKIVLYFEEHLNIKHGQIYSVIKLSEIQIKKIESKITKKLNQEVKLFNYLDKNIIGGICVRVEDYIWDNSIKTKLKNLKKDLLIYY